MKHRLSIALAALSAGFYAFAQGPAACLGQDTQTATAIAQSSRQPVPNLAPAQGVVADHAGEKHVLRFAVYEAEDSRDPLWSEEQPVTLGVRGEYSVLLGAGSGTGLPQGLFATGEPRWLGVQVGEREEPRTLLASVPYAMKAADAETLAGHAASNFVTQEQLAASFKTTAAALAAQSIEPLVAGTVTGSGTTGYVPLWTGASALGTSVLNQVGTGASAKVGIKTTNPATSLDVNGNQTLRGYLTMLPASAATATAGVYSPLLELSASSFLAGGAAKQKTFAWQAQPTGNNTTTPSADLRLLFGSGGAAFAATGLSIAANGVITFAPAQSFPSAATLFPKGATFDAESYITGSSADYMLKAINSNPDGTGAIYAQGAGYAPGIVAKSASGYGVLGLAGDGIGGGFSNASSGNPTLSVSNTIGPAADLIAASDTVPAFSVTNSSSAGGAVGIQSTVSTGTALVLSSPNGNGLVSTVALGSAGSFISSGILNPTLSAVNGTGTALYSKSSGGLVSAAYLLSEGDYQDAAEIVNLANGDALYAHAGTGVAGFFQNTSGVDPTVYAYNRDGNQIGTLFKTFMADSASGTCGIGGGNLSCTGQLKSLVAAGGGARKVETYAVQSPENWMEDFGSGVLERGVAVVGIDPTFAETVSESAAYHVFLTPKGDSRGLYVINETAASFEVRESGGGISSLAFDYRIVAKRRGFEAQRHVDVTESYRSAMERSILNRKPAQGGEPVLPVQRIVSPQAQAPSVQRPQILPTPQIAQPPAAERRLQAPPHLTAAK